MPLNLLLFWKCTSNFVWIYNNGYVKKSFLKNIIFELSTWNSLSTYKLLLFFLMPSTQHPLKNDVWYFFQAYYIFIEVFGFLTKHIHFLAIIFILRFFFYFIHICRRICDVAMCHDLEWKKNWVTRQYFIKNSL